MKEQSKKSPIWISIIMIVAGIIMILWPEWTLKSFSRILGIILILGAIVVGIAVYSDVKKNTTDKKLSKNNLIYIICAVVALILGIISVAAPKLATTVYLVIIAAIIIINGIINIVNAFKAKKNGDNKWYITAIIAAVEIVLGILVVCDPFSTATVLMVFIGIVLIIVGISNFYVIKKKNV